MIDRTHIGCGLTAGVLALAVALLCGCRKEGPAEAGQALCFSANVQSETRTFIPGTSLEDATAGRLPIFATGTFYGQDGTASTLFTEQKFEYAAGDGKYHASPAAYWPVGGSADFLAYAGPASSAPASNPTVTWPGTHAADKARFAFTDTKAANMDLVWAVANDRTNNTAPVDLTFSHALARLVLQVKDTEDRAVGNLHLNTMELRTGTDDKLCLGGIFTVDNTLNVPVAAWSGLTATSDWHFFSGENVSFTSTGSTNLVGDLSVPAKTGEFVPLVEMYVPEQPSKNIVVTYHIGDALMDPLEINLSRMTWLPGHTYTYQITFNVPEVIGLEATVTAWVTDTTRDLELR